MRVIMLLLAVAAVVGCGKKPEVAVAPPQDEPQIAPPAEGGPQPPVAPQPQQPDESGEAKPLPADVVKAWTNAGAEVGWMDADGRFDTFAARWNFPAFKFREWKDGVIAMLPLPDAPFGLSLSNTRVTDERLKELARFRNLTTLALPRKVTDGVLRSLREADLLHVLRVAKTADYRRARRSEDVVWLSLYQAPVTDVGLKELAALRNLTTLYLGETVVTDVGMKELAGLGKLTTLNLSRTRVTDRGAQELASLSHLTFLDLSGTKVTAVGLEHLAKLRDLTRLSVPVTDGVLRVLAKAKKLHALESAKAIAGERALKDGDVVWLDLSKTAVTDAGLMELAGLQNLSSLDLSGTAVANAELNALTKLPNLTTLDLRGSKVTTHGLRGLAGLPKLTALLPAHQVSDEMLRVLREVNLLHALKNASAGKDKRPTNAEEILTLDLAGTTVTDVGLKELAGLRNLTTLSLYGIQVTDKGLRVLDDLGLLHALQNAGGLDGKRPTKADEVVSLYLSNTRLTDTGLKGLERFKNLTELELHATEVTDDGLKQLRGFHKLTLLSLSYTKVTDSGLKELASFKGLVTLSLEGTKVTDAGLTEVVGLKNLSKLYLSKTMVTATGVAELKKSLPTCEVIRH